MVKSTEDLIREMERICGENDGEATLAALEIMKLRRLERIAETLEGIERELKRRR